MKEETIIMKKLAMASICVLSTMTSAFAQIGPVDPMENYTPTLTPKKDLDRIWNEMRTDLKGKDCYKRAHLWAHDMYKNDGIESRKIFIHYTNKFNIELDNLGREEGLSWMKRKKMKIEGVNDRIIGMIRSNITWDYHVAPMLNVDGKDVVMDRYLGLPYGLKGNYTVEQAYKFSKKPATPQEWVEALTVRGELLWEARRQELRNEIKEYKAKYDKATGDNRKAKFRALLVKAQNSYKRLEMDKIPTNERIDIKCRKITSMVELDKNQLNEWCFWSETPMYYFNELDLRNLAYGYIPGVNFAGAVDPIHATEENFKAGRKYIQTEFNPKELEVALSEVKSGSEEQARREEEERRLEDLRREREREERRARRRARRGE